MILPFYEHNLDLLKGSSDNILNFPLHLHNTPEIVHVQSGRLKVQLHTEEYIMQAGDFLIILPNIIHSYETLTPSQDTKINLIVCGQDALSTFPKKYMGVHIENPIAPLSSFHPDVEYVFLQLLREVQSKPDNYILHAYLQILWRRALPSLRITNTLQPAVSDIAANMITYITEHFCEPLSLDVLSKEIGVCRFYLSRIFTQVLHIGFHEYINALRINYAKDLLHNEKATILDIALQCGFQNQQTFNRIFKDLCGMTPSAYRKSI